MLSTFHLVESRKSGSNWKGMVPSSMNQSSWNEKLMKVANIASILCVIDCTILPIFVVLLSVTGMGSSDSTTHHSHDLVHTIGHSIANFVVLPVAILVTCVNFFNKKMIPGFLSFTGLVLIYVTNSHGGIFNRFKLVNQVLHILHENEFWHRAVDLTGVACMLSANYLSNVKGCTCCSDLFLPKQ